MEILNVKKSMMMMELTNSSSEEDPATSFGDIDSFNEYLLAPTSVKLYQAKSQVIG